MAHSWRPIALVLMFGVAKFGTACSASPTTPLPSSTPVPVPAAPTTVQPVSTLYHLSGVVTDDAGVPRPNVYIYLDAYDGHASARSDGTGSYNLDFTTIPFSSLPRSISS